MLILILLVFAFVCASLAAFSVPSGSRLQFGWLAFALVILAWLIGGHFPLR